VWFKDYEEHVKRVSRQVRQESGRAFRQQGRPEIYLGDPAADKEALARGIAAQDGVAHGLVCALSTVEPSPSFEHRGTHIVRRMKPCGVLYHYQIHPEVGWMYARLPTWFPFTIPVGINGREWLARQMDRAGLQYRQQGNCFVWIEDYEQAQKLLRRQLETNWAALLDGWAAPLNPLHASLLERYPTDYY
jgi:hypothetical protein